MLGCATHLILLAKFYAKLFAVKIEIHNTLLRSQRQTSVGQTSNFVDQKSTNINNEIVNINIDSTTKRTYHNLKFLQRQTCRGVEKL